MSIRCGYCNGTGKRELSENLRQALARVPASPAAKTAPDIAREWGVINKTTVNARLMVLEQMGLVRRVGKLGKAYRWQRVGT